MGLFSRKKERDKGDIQAEFSDTDDLPEFPDLSEGDFPEFPSYEPTINEIKTEVDRDSDKFEMPVREGKLAKKTMISEELPIESRREIPEGSKPLFVQIERYKEVIHTIDSIKSKLEDVDLLLNNFEHIRDEENKKLEEWKKDLQNIKEKLVSIDRDLFEV